MEKVRNAVIVIALCIIGGYGAYKPATLALKVPPPDSLHDALAGNPTVQASRPGLHLSNSDDDQLRDSVAGNAIPGFPQNGNNTPRGNTGNQTPLPPRGGDYSGPGSYSQPSPGSQLPPPAPLSPSGPSHRPFYGR